MARARCIVISWAIDNFNVQVVKHCDDKRMELPMTGAIEHRDEKCKEYCDEQSI